MASSQFSIVCSQSYSMGRGMTVVLRISLVTQCGGSPWKGQEMVVVRREGNAKRAVSHPHVWTDGTEVGWW